MIVGIPLIAYSPISRGWLTGEFRKPEDIRENDMRRFLPRFQPGVFEQNFKLVEAVERIAKRHGASTAQLAIAWVRRQGAIPIPGSTRVERVVENCQDVPLTEQDLEEIQTLLATLPVAGERYGGQHEKLLNM
jgi:pyridoxine 4-dehydrogenase